MILDLQKDKFIKINKSNFNLVQTLECGQVFSYKLTSNGAVVMSADKICFITEEENYYLLKTDDTSYFINYFDLKSDYSKIKSDLLKHKILEDPIKFGYGIRLLNQDIFETIISFIVSANNNIKRITKILDKIRCDFGKKLANGYYSFPTLNDLKDVKADYFKGIGAGYRAVYLEKVLKELEDFNFDGSKNLSTQELREKLIKLSGVGPKVADCILLFAYSRYDVFPVDTWIAQMYNEYFEKCDNRNLIRKELVKKFGNLSGYAQQYLFYFKRSLK